MTAQQIIAVIGSNDHRRARNEHTLQDLVQGIIPKVHYRRVRAARGAELMRREVCLTDVDDTQGGRFRRQQRCFKVGEPLNIVIPIHGAVA